MLLPSGEHLEVAAYAGAPMSADDRRRLQPTPGQVTGLDTVTTEIGRKRRRRDPVQLALVASGRPVGLLIISGAAITDQQREPLLLFANQIALAVDRAQLREQALRAQLTEEVEHLARTLVAAVSHDLRAPLSSIKASSSILADPQLNGALDPTARQELAALIDTQSDRLAALVTNVLDMSRVQAGVLKPRASVTSVADLVANVIADLPQDSPARRADIHIPANLPPVDIDTVLIGRVLTNLLDNASRHAPPNTPITICARAQRPRPHHRRGHRPRPRYRRQPPRRDLRPLRSPRSRHRHRPRTGNRQDLPRRAWPTNLGR